MVAYVCSADCGLTTQEMDIDGIYGKLLHLHLNKFISASVNPS